MFKTLYLQRNLICSSYLDALWSLNGFCMYRRLVRKWMLEEKQELNDMV
jgi:hypothetical protein